MVIDEAAMVRMLDPGLSETFQDYCDKIITPYIKCQCTKYKRIDVVFDIYIENSIKSTTY